VHGGALRSAGEAAIVHVRDGEMLVSDGPFAETKEQLGGYCVIECAYRDHVELVETVGAGPAVLVRPDGHVAAKGGPARMPAISGYLRGLFGEPGSVPAAVPPGALSQPAASQPAAVTRGQ